MLERFMWRFSDLQELLKGDTITYSVFPVSGYEDIQRHADKGISQNDEVNHQQRPDSIMREVHASVSCPFVMQWATGCKISSFSTQS